MNFWKTMFKKLNNWWYKKTWYFPYYIVSQYIPSYDVKNHCLMCHAYVKCSEGDGYPVCQGKEFCPCKDSQLHQPKGGCLNKRD